MKFVRIFFFVIVNMGTSGSENFNWLLLLQIAAIRFQTSTECTSTDPHQTTLGISEIVTFGFFNGFYFENFKNSPLRTKTQLS